MLAHGALLRKNIFSAEELIAIVTDYHDAGLSDEEVALMSFAQKISLDAQNIGEADITGLRAFGLSDEDILNVVLVCTARNFFSKTLDALDATPDEVYRELEPELIKALSLGRPFPLPTPRHG
jgi:alkylhydroperoxidase family enzyme